MGLGNMPHNNQTIRTRRWVCTGQADALTYGLNNHCVHFVRTELQLVAGEAVGRSAGWGQSGIHITPLNE